MNARNILSASAIALLGSLTFAAHAGEIGNEADYRALQVQSGRTVADAHAEGVYAARHISRASTSAFVHPAGSSTVARADVRASAVQAQRNGSIVSGEILSF